MTDNGASGTGGTPSPWRGGVITPRAACVLAPNPGPVTLDGTNTWLLAEPGSEQVVVIDPGPLDDGHLRAVLAQVERTGRRVARTLLTHGHPDHAEGARRFAELAGCGVQALDPAQRLGSEGLADGDVVAVNGLEIRVVATPGHSSDSLCFVLPADGAVLTGDTILGRGTTVVAHPDGRLGDYLDSLRRLADLADTGVGTVLPGHGPALRNAAAVVAYYLDHRRERLDQVRAALAAGARTAAEVTAAVYVDVPAEVLWAAELSVRAQLDYLRERGELRQA